MSTWSKVVVYALFLIVLSEAFGQFAVRIRSGVFPWSETATSRIFEPHPFLVGTPRPGANEDRSGGGMRINSQGFRGPELSTQSADSVTRILALGGSTTFGTRIGQDETWPQQLQQALGTALRSGTSRERIVEVVNAGVPGYSSAENLIQLALQGVHMNPDVVILFQGINDLHNSHSPSLRSDYSDFHGPMQWTSLQLHRLKWGNRSGIVRLGREALELAFTYRRPSLPPGPRRAGNDERAEEIFRNNLQTFADICGGRAIPCLFVPQVLREGERDLWWFKYLESDDIDDQLDRYNAIMQQVAELTGMGFAGDVLEVDWPGPYFSDTQHFSGAGNKRFADILLPYVLDLIDPVNND